MKLYIGNKNYSSWSLRPWLLMREAGIDFEEVKLRLSMTEGSAFKRQLAPITPTGRVPVLVEDDGFAVWDTLAIAEYLAERFPDRGLWPQDPRQRARARSICAEMHAGFSALRNAFPMNIEARLPDVGARLLAQDEAVQRDLNRILVMWSELLVEHGGGFLFGARFTIADAYYAPVCWRIRGYGLPVTQPVAGYVERVLSLPSMRAWEAEALAEDDFLEEDEPYRTRPAAT